MGESLFTESLQLILDESKTYYTIMENTYYINETSFKEYIKKIDFKKIFKFILEKFLEIIKKIWNRFRAAYNKFTNDSVLLKRYRKKLENIDWDINFPDSRDIYTRLDDSTNINMYKLSLDKQISTLVQDLEKISNCRSINDIHTNMIEIANKFEDNISYLDEERGISLSSYSSIPQSDYPEQVFNYFYPGQKIAPGIMHPSEVKKITKEYFESKTIEKRITAEENSLEGAAKKIINIINTTDINKYIPDQQINSDISNLFINILRGYSNRVQGLCNIYIQLFSIKLDVFKKYKEQQVHILTKIIIRSIKEGKM